VLLAVAVTTVWAQTRVGTIYSMTSEPSANRVIAYPRLSDGTLGTPVYYFTGGLGSGDNPSPIPAGPHDGNQAEKGVIVNRAATLLFVTNGGDNTVTVFSIDRGNNGALTIISIIDSGGEYPVALNLSPDESVLYILNSAGLGRLHSVPIVNFQRFNTGRRSSTVTIGQTYPAYPIAGLNNTGGLQVDPTGSYVLVSEKGQSLVRAYKTRRNRLVPTQFNPPTRYQNTRAWSWSINFYTQNQFLLSCINATPNAFPIGPDSLIQSYSFNSNTGQMTLLDEVNVFGGNICWMVLAPNGVWYFSGPTRVGIWALRVDSATGALTPLQTSETGLGTALASDGTLYGGGDIWASPDGYIYLNGQAPNDNDRITSPALFVFRINPDSTLTQTYFTRDGRPIQGAIGY